MSDQRIQDTEARVGANHATLADTLNRLCLAGGMISDGSRDYLLLNHLADDPDTGDAPAIYVKSDGNLYTRQPSNGEIRRLT